LINASLRSMIATDYYDLQNIKVNKRIGSGPMGERVRYWPHHFGQDTSCRNSRLFFGACAPRIDS
jgi:hypothetical protein